MPKKISPIQSRLDFILPILRELPKTSKIMDLGCGTGVLTKELYRRTKKPLIGIDLDQENITYAKKACPKNRYYVQDVKDIDVNNRYDVIICSELLEHLSHPGSLLHDIHKALTTNGILIITIPNGYGLWELFENQPLEYARDFTNQRPKAKRAYYWLRDKLGARAKDSLNSNEGSRHLQRFTYDSIRCLLERNGFSIVKMKSLHVFGELLVPRLLSARAPWIYRFDQRICNWWPRRAASGWGIVVKKSAAKSAVRHH